MRTNSAALLLLLAATACSSPRIRDPRLAAASRRDEAGWIVLHLEGAPSTIGFQYGWLAADEIDDALAMFKSYVPTACKRDWRFFRRTTEELYWPKLDEEQRAEIDGIVEGVRARGKSIDREDVVAINGWMEIGWYDIPAIDGRDNAAPGNCSAFIATGSWTSDGGIVMAHNAWVDYVVGERWNLVLDIVPEHGHRMFMDSFPGFIDSGDDFALNDAGLMVTETTITQFKGFDPAGVPEFARARRAIQYADSIDEWARIMREGNNGAYANSWLVGDRKTGEIARLELGLKNTPMERTKDGCFVGSNFPCDAKLREEETTFDAKDEHNSANVRRKRWETLMAENRGRIDVEAGKRFLADHVDARDGAAGTSPSTTRARPSGSGPRRIRAARASARSSTRSSRASSRSGRAWATRAERRSARRGSYRRTPNSTGRSPSSATCPRGGGRCSRRADGGGTWTSGGIRRSRPTRQNSD